MKKINVLAVLVLLAGTTFAQTTWTIDKPHTSVGFAATHMVVAETAGSFKDFDGQVISKAEDFNGATVEFSAKVASLSTDNEKRDGHLKSDDFFSAEKFPEIKFKGVLSKDGGKYVLKGDLTMRDVTKPATFDVVYKGSINAFGGTKAGFKLTGSVNRFDYGLKWDKTIETGGLIVGQDIAITSNIELNKAK